MASKFLAVWLLLSLIASSPIVFADCPPLEIPPPGDFDRDRALPYFTVRSQADADLLATCDTFKGDLFISGSNASAPLVIPGPTYIKGSLKMMLAPHTDPGLTFLTMSSLVSVSGGIELSQNSRFNRRTVTSHVTMISFPLLEHSRWTFDIQYLPTVTTLDFPRLSRANYLNLIELPALHNLSVPVLTAVSQLFLQNLLALHTLSFPGPLNSGFFPFGPAIIIDNTSISQISGLSFPSATGISISSNKNLHQIVFPFLTIISPPRDYGVGSIYIRDNGNDGDFELDLPKLKRLKSVGQSRNIGADMLLFHVRMVKIPELQFVDGDLSIGASSTLPNPQSNDSTALTHFSALKLSQIGGSLNIGNSSLLEFVSFPALKTIGGDVRISDIPAVGLEKGIEVPKLGRVHGVHVFGSAPHCEDWEAKRSRGMLWGEWFWCEERERWTVDDMERKLWGDRLAFDHMLKHRFGINDCETYERRWCVKGRGLTRGGVGRVVFAMLVVYIGIRRIRRMRCRRTVHG